MQQQPIVQRLQIVQLALLSDAPGVAKHSNATSHQMTVVRPALLQVFAVARL